jgi:hypothetical protein
VVQRVVFDIGIPGIVLRRLIYSGLVQGCTLTAISYCCTAPKAINPALDAAHATAVVSGGEK